VVGGIKVSALRAAALAGRPNTLQLDAAVQIGTLSQGKHGLFDSDEFPHAGRFSKFTGTAQYVQNISGGLSASLKGSVQVASRHLDGSEQMSLSGMQGVRGYGPELSGVDNGAVVQAALTQQIRSVPGLSTSVFYDHGRGQINKRQALDGIANTLTVSSAGVGVNYQYKEKVAVSVSWAKPIGATPKGQPVTRGGQAWLSTSLIF